MARGPRVRGGAGVSAIVQEPITKRGKAKGKGMGVVAGKGAVAGKGKSSKGGQGGAGGGKAGASAPQQYEKIKGTRIQQAAGGSFVRVVIASGKVYAPNDVRGAVGHIAKLEGGGDATPSRSNGQGGHQQQKGKGKGRPLQQNGQKAAPSRSRELGTKGGGAKGNGAKGSGVKGAAKGASKGAGKQGGKAATKKMVVSKFAAKSLKKSRGRSKGKERERKELTPEEIEERQQKRAERDALRLEKENRAIVDDDEFHDAEVVRAGKFNAWVKPSTLKEMPADVKKSLQTMNNEMRAKAKQEGKEFMNGVKGMIVYVRNSDVAEEGLRLKPGMQIKFKYYVDIKGVGAHEVMSA